MSVINFSALKNNIIDVIKESQIKLGFSSNEANLNYPLDSLNNLLRINYTVDELENALNEFTDHIKNELGSINVANDQNNFCITIPVEGVKYINEKIKAHPFLTEFIGLLKSNCNVTIDDILRVFNKYSDNVECIEVNNDEFNYLVCFKGGIPDNFRYFIDIDLGHATYHRLTPSDYESLGYGY